MSLHCGIPGHEPTDGFEPPYEPYEDPVLPLYDAGIPERKLFVLSPRYIKIISEFLLNVK